MMIGLLLPLSILGVAAEQESLIKDIFQQFLWPRYTDLPAYLQLAGSQ